MITKIYEVTCDRCGCVINHYMHYKPSNKELRDDGAVIRHNNGKVLLYCQDCYSKLK